LGTDLKSEAAGQVNQADTAAEGAARVTSQREG
jgi:hypothetical protein